MTYTQQLAWIPICVLMSVGTHYLRKNLKKKYLKEKEHIKEIRDTLSTTAFNYKNNFNEMLGSYVWGLNLAKWFFAFGAFYILLDVCLRYFFNISINPDYVLE